MFKFLIILITICCFSEYKDREKKKSKYSLKCQRCGQPVITFSTSLLNHSEITEGFINFYFLILVLTIATNVYLTWWCFFLFEEPVNQLFLFHTSKNDIVRRTNEDEASRMLQSVLKLITKVRFMLLQNRLALAMFQSMLHHRIQR